MKKELKDTLVKAIRLYREKEERNIRTGNLSARWDDRLKEVTSNIDNYTLSPADHDLTTIIEDQIQGAQVYYRNERKTIENLNQLYYIIHGCYSSKFYWYAASVCR